jgi:predicted MPP superfamily phosphohydrolase
VTDSGVDPAESMRVIFDGQPITVLHNETVCLPFEDTDLCLIGIQSHRGALERDRAVLESLSAQTPADAYQLLLYHTPDLAESLSGTGIDLYLAGHTHGGQIRLPFYGAVVTFSAYGKKYEMGRYTLDGTMLYVSRGLGMEGSGAPRARFLCPPEIVVVDIGPEGSTKD